MQHLLFVHGIATPHYVLCKQLLPKARAQHKTLSRPAAVGLSLLRLGSTTASSQRSISTRQRMPHTAATSFTQADTAKSLDAASEVVIITTVGCQFCKRAKESLQRSQVDFEEVEASNQPELLTKIKDLTGRKTVPQIFVGGRLLGGADDLAQLIADGKFQQLLQGAHGKPALPKELQEAVDNAAKSTKSNIDAAFRPAGMSAAQFTELKRIAAELQHHFVKSEHGRTTFSAAEASQWLCQQHSMQQQQAKDTLSGLQQAHQVSTVGSQETALTADLDAAQLAGVQLQLVNAAPSPHFGQPLNTHYAWFGSARGPSEISASLRTVILHLYDKHLAADGKALNYSALSADPAFQTYVKATAELQKADLTALDREERMAFFINIYNAIVVHALAVFGPASNLKQRLSFFNAIKYNIGGQIYSANDMEHGVLRGNRPTPVNPWVLLGKPNWSSGYFKDSDPRKAHVVNPMDPRIHFALVCGAKSCPPIKVYTPDSLEDGLDSATMAFCEGEVVIKKEERTAEISKIFKWYKQDFGPQEQLLPWLLQYLAGSSKVDLQDLLSLVGAKHVKISYRHYDWSLNSQE